jgi:hypothetical protein
MHVFHSFLVETFHGLSIDYTKREALSTQKVVTVTVLPNQTGHRIVRDGCDLIARLSNVRHIAFMSSYSNEQSRVLKV